ncbi:MAG: helix-turn-helix domain-containing protein [Candidatus Paceibacteria bacterium]
MKHPVDAHVGKRIRHRRWMVGMTQAQLADKVGVKFQQIQKYETGINRISASRLWDVADALGVSISFFFEGLEHDVGVMNDQFSKDTAALARDYDGLDDDQKKVVRKLVTSLMSQPAFIRQKTG